MFASVSPPAARTPRGARACFRCSGCCSLASCSGSRPGYLAAPRSHPATPTASAIRPQVQPAPVPPPPSAAQTEPPAQVIQATTDNPDRMTARDRRLARVRARREATKSAVAKGGAGTAAVGRKASPARTGIAFEGGLVIASKPAGARVMLDGRPVGTTPLTLTTMRAGSHVVRLELTGYAVWSSSVQVTAGAQNRVTASLERRPPG